MESKGADGNGHLLWFTVETNYVISWTFLYPKFCKEKLT